MIEQEIACELATFHLQRNNQRVLFQAQITTLKMMKKSVPTNLQQTKMQINLKNSLGPSTSVASISSTPIKVKVQTPLKSPPPKDKPMPQKTPKARQAETLAVQPKQENIRDNIVKTLSEQLLNRLKNVNDLTLTEEEVNNNAIVQYECLE